MGDFTYLNTNTFLFFKKRGNQLLRGHVFIVNEYTLPKHLEYMFVGVGAGEKDSNIGLLADIFRVKKDDYIFFYIEGRGSKKGRFFGVFKASDNEVFHFTGKDATKPELYKKEDEPLKLIYRKKIKPFKVFQKGVLEWIALDKLPTYAKEVLWTLLYRKMKGRRGNTMLFPWETEKLISLIKDANEGEYLNNIENFTFNKKLYIIKKNDYFLLEYNIENIGRKIVLEKKLLKSNETAFQAYILQNLNVNENKFFPEIFGKNVVWIGNEVYAGSGMQKIDLLTIEKLDETSFIYRIIELKHYKSKDNINNAPEQMEYYINWAREDIGGHVLGSKRYNIKPIVVYLTDKFNKTPNSVIQKFRNLRRISYEPEILEIDISLNINKLL